MAGLGVRNFSAAYKYSRNNCTAVTFASPMAPRTHNDYTVGWICALPIELEASFALMDEPHPPLSRHPMDTNSYHLGRIGSHNVAMACLPDGQTGTNSAATVAAHMSRSFRSIRFGLLVGIAGGAPSKEHDIRLGDVVVGVPGKKRGGVIQYDFGKAIKEGEFEHTGFLNAPPAILLAAISALRADPSTSQSLNQLLDNTYTDQSKFSYPEAENDILFKSDYDHVSESSICDNCDGDRLEIRNPRDSQIPIIHYGTVASANQVMRHGGTRERLRNEHDILCFEMEAAGLVNTFPCLVIRGICDYADTHKHKQWQPYAAATAAAFAKHLLTRIPAEGVKFMASVSPMPWFYYAFSNSLVPLKTVSLGRLTVSIQEPWKDYCPESIEPPENDVVTSYNPLMHKILQNSKHGRIYEKLRHLFESVAGLPLQSFTQTPETTYMLMNPGNHFRNLCDHDKTRGWFEKTLRYGINVYMITGIHTIQMPIVAIDPAMDESSEQVFAFRYQKVKFRWFSSRTMKNASLDKSRWKVSDLIGRETGNINDVDDLVQAELDDAIDLEDLKDEGEICAFEDELFVV